MSLQREIYIPNALDIGLARKVAKATHESKYVLSRSSIQMWSFFARRRSAMILHEGKPIAHAAITLKKNGFEEVGAVMTWEGWEGNGYAKDVVLGIIQRRSRPGKKFFAIVDKENNPSIKLFENKLGGTRMNPDDVPKKRKYRKDPELFLRKIGFNITHLARRDARALAQAAH